MRPEVAWKFFQKFFGPERHTDLACRASTSPVDTVELGCWIANYVTHHCSIVWRATVSNRRQWRTEVGVTQLLYLLISIDPKVGEIAPAAHFGSTHHAAN